MKKLKINQNNSLKRVLSVDEMKSICGGMNASIICSCTLFKKKIGSLELEEVYDEPTGDFHTDDSCKSACATTCTNTVNCVKSTHHFNKSGGYGSESGSDSGSV